MPAAGAVALRPKEARRGKGPGGLEVKIEPAEVVGQAPGPERRA